MSSLPDRTVVSQGGAYTATTTTCTTCGLALAASDAACPQCGVGRGSPAEQAERMRARLQAQIGDAYELVELLGRGGMGIVFRARERALDRDVALKVLTLDPVLAPEAWTRFEREAKLAAKLDHPHIVPVYAVGQGSGVAYYTMRLVRGGSVEDLLADRRPLDVGRTVDILRAVAAALDYAHRHGVVHRDVKPANLLLQDGHAMVADFGIAKALEGGEHAAGLTGTGAIGSPGYMAPEQWRGEAIDGRADQYALGIVAFEMITGRRPFEAVRVQDLFKLHQSAAVPDAIAMRPGLDASVQQALVRALAKYPSERFASASAFVDALAARRPAAAPRPVTGRNAPAPPPRRRSRALLVAAALLLVTAAAAATPPARPYVQRVVAPVRAEVDAFLNPGAARPVRERAPHPDSLLDVGAPGLAAVAPAAPESSLAVGPEPERPPVGLDTSAAIPANFRRVPTASLGFIRVLTRGGSARARIDGRTLGFTPLVIRVEPGMHYVSVEGAGDIFLPTQHALEAAADDTVDAVFTTPGWTPSQARAAVPPVPAPVAPSPAPATAPDSSAPPPRR